MFFCTNNREDNNTAEYKLFKYFYMTYEIEYCSLILFKVIKCYSNKK